MHTQSSAASTPTTTTTRPRTPSPVTSTRAMAKRCMQWAEINGKRRLLVGGRVNKFIPNPTFDPIAKPGSLEDYFRGRNEGGIDLQDDVRRPRADRRPPRTATATPGCSCSTSRAWTARSCSRRSASACRRPSRTTCLRCTPRSAPSTGGSTTTGASTTRSGSSRRRTSRCPTSTSASRSSSGCSTAVRAS